MQLDLSSTDYWAEIFTTKNYLGEKSMQAVKEKKKDRIKKEGAAGQNGKQGRMQCGLLWTCLIPTTPVPFPSFSFTPPPLPPLHCTFLTSPCASFSLLPAAATRKR